MPGTITPEDGDEGATGKAPDAGAGAPAGGSEPKKLEFTQDELDRIIADRVARAKPKDYDDLVKLRDAKAAADEKEKSDLQKEKDARVAAEAKAAETEAKANRILVKAAITTEAAAQNAADADTVFALLAGDESITVDGETVKGAKQAVKKLLEDKPFLVKTTTAGASGGEFGGNDAKTIAEKIKEAESKGDWSTARQLKLAQVVTASRS